MIDCALIGSGEWFDEVARRSPESKALRLKRLCDPDAGNLQALSERHSYFRVSDDIKDVLRDDEVEAVIVAAPLGLRHGILKACLESGKHCLAANPPAADVSAAEELLELAEKKQLLLMSAQKACYSGPARLLKAMIERNEISTVEFYEAARLTLPPRRRNMHVIWELACEEVALMNYLLGCEPQYVNAVSLDSQRDRRQDLAYLTFNFENELLAHLRLNRACMVQESSVVIGSRHETVLVDRLKPGGEICVYRQSSSRNLAGSRDSSDRNAMRAGDAWLPRIEALDEHLLMLAEFADCIKHGRKPTTDGHAGVQSVRAVCAAMRSAAGGGVSIPLWPSAWY